MNEMTFQQCSDLYNVFSAADYRTRLTLFDQHFRLIPFRFPLYDPAISWYTNPAELDALIGIYNEERKKGHQFYRRTVSFGEASFLFNVQPLQVAERDVFHSFVLQKFLAEKDRIHENFLIQLRGSPTKRHLINEQLAALNHTVRWIAPTLRKNPRSLPTLFLQVLYNGFHASRIELTSAVKVRRKFIELYLYSQGLLLSAHLKWLTALKEEHQSDTDPQPLSLRQKIALLEETGVVDFLKNRDLREGKDEYAAIIALLTSEGPIDFQKVSILLKAMHTGQAKDPISRKNLLFIEHQLERFRAGQPAP